MASESNGNGLAIDRLRVQGFRVFEDVEFERFGRLNLITGRNGTGKTTLLEAIRVFATLGEPNTLREILGLRDEDVNPGVSGHYRFDSDALTSLFSDRGGHGFVIESGGRKVTGEYEGGVLELLGNSQAHRQLIAGLGYSIAIVEHLPAEIRCEFVGTSGVSNDVAGPLWDKIALTPLEDDIVKSLSIVVRGLSRVTMTGQGNHRTPRARLEGIDSPVLMRSLGDGASRIFGIALALCNAKDGVLLIDEVENGIHYSAQEQLWRFLVDASRRLNVQVFATTHSSDAVRAFQAATGADAAVEGILTRLELRKGKIRVSRLTEPELEIAVNEEIEVR